MGFGLKVASADLVVDFPVFVLAESAAVARHVATAARLVGYTAAVPAHLFQQFPNSLYFNVVFFSLLLQE